MGRRLVSFWAVEYDYGLSLAQYRSISMQCCVLRRASRIWPDVSCRKGSSSRRITSLIGERLHFVSQHNLCNSSIRALVQSTTTDKAFLIFCKRPDGPSRCAWWWHDVSIGFHSAVAARHPHLLIHPEAPSAIALPGAVSY